jgi:acetyl-CoA carboxylase biotin carboxylase subunit
VGAVIARLLVANRGEIAVRVIRACREAGIESVAVCSDADAGAPHAVLADHVVRIGPAPAAESYLNPGRIIDAARTAGADAVHPGYGFLSENAAFAAACEDAGLVFVGPPADAIARMGSKTEARRIAAAAGVPVVPGATPADQGLDGLRAAAKAVGYPVLLKASAGGGGKGMRVVGAPADFDEAAGAARREATAAFGDGTLYVERRIDRPRHVEIQILGDAHGSVVHLFERECSAQRRHQKVVEESPCPALSPRLRAEMGAAAVRAAQAVGYRSAGTVEFLLDGAGADARYYFLEMNTRLQVEHPVTEAVTGVDLVRAQFDIANGRALPWTQDGLSQRGHAIECRIYAEDPASGFVPQAGRVLLYREPAGPGLRIDSGIVEGSEVPVHYDPLLVKLIAAAETRIGAIERARAALRQFPILGIRTNVAFLLRLLSHPDFLSAGIDTGFLDREADELVSPPPAESTHLAMAVAASLAGALPATPGTAPSAAGAIQRDPWTALGGWSRPA